MIDEGGAETDMLDGLCAGALETEDFAIDSETLELEGCGVLVVSVAELVTVWITLPESDSIAGRPGPCVCTLSLKSNRRSLARAPSAREMGMRELFIVEEPRVTSKFSVHFYTFPASLIIIINH